MAKIRYREQVATAVAILFHVIGLFGILVFNNAFIIHATPINLLLMLGLLVWTQREKNIAFFLCAGIIVVAGFIVEVVGVNTGYLFGDYAYGKVLGPQLIEVPFIIGANWFIIIYCCGIAVHTLLTTVLNSIAEDTANPSPSLKAISLLMDGATLATIFDWLMEPVAVKLGFWQWAGDGSVPFFNYLCWFVISIILMTVFHFSVFSKNNRFAINLLLIQFMFFLLLRTFME